MSYRPLAFAIFAGACGEVARTPVDGAPPADAPELARTYKGHLDQTTPVAFGGDPFCNYTITLQQLDVELSILPSGKVTSGKVQDLNVEAAVGPCDNLIPPNIATYTLASAAPSADGMTLTFQGAATNQPSASLTVNLTSVGQAHSAKLGFHRNDLPQIPAVSWTVITSVTLNPQ